jgi:hypothetical protein
MPPKIEFEYDQPVTLHLRYRHGLEVASKYYECWPGDTTQYVFSAEEGVFYLSDTAGGLLNPPCVRSPSNPAKPSRSRASKRRIRTRRGRSPNILPVR